MRSAWNSLVINEFRDDRAVYRQMTPAALSATRIRGQMELPRHGGVNSLNRRNYETKHLSEQNYTR